VEKTWLLFQVIDQQHRTKMFEAPVTDYAYLDGEEKLLKGERAHPSTIY
jgi:hypothetical protein